MAENTLSIREKIGYGMGDAGCNIIFGAIMLFVNYFYTDIFGLALSAGRRTSALGASHRCGNRPYHGRSCRPHP